MIRESIESHARVGVADPVALETLRNDVDAAVRSIRSAMERATEFASRGLVSEAAALVEDFPDLARQAQELVELPRSSTAAQRFWAMHVDGGSEPCWLPTAEDVDQLAGIVGYARQLRPLLDGLRIAALRRESIGARLAILRKLREADARNRTWLDEIETLEREWIKRIGEMRTAAAPPRAELEEAFTALASRQWVAPVPRGLKDEIYQLLKPMRAEEAGDRYAELSVRIHDASSLMDRAELEQLEAAWAAVYHETGRMPSEELQQVVAPAFEWLGRMAEDDRLQGEFDALVAELDRALDRRSPAAEIERLVAALRDAGRSAPDGVLARAHAWISAEHDRARRRHRFVLLSSLAAAVVVIAAGTLAVRAYSLVQDQRGSFAALSALLDSGDAPAATELADRISNDPRLMTAEMQALISRTAAAQADWDATRARIAGSTAAIARALDGNPDRKTLAGIAAQLGQLVSDSRLREERAALEVLQQRQVDRLLALDAADARVTDEALRAAEQRLRDWPIPERWKPSEQIDVERWQQYRGALSQAKDSMQRTLADITGSTLQEERIRLAIDGVDERIAEATARSAALSQALVEIGDGPVGAPVSSESDFVERLRTLLAKHGSTLQRQGVLDDFEQSQECGPAWRAVQSWRDEVYPKLALSLRAPADEPSSRVALEALQSHLAAHPSTPHRESAEVLIRRLDPANAMPLWSTTRLQGALRDHFYTGLEIVPIRGGDRYFYRRLSSEARSPMQRAIENLADLGDDPAKLNSMLLPPGEQIQGTTSPSAVSRAWQVAEQSLEAAGASPQEVLLDLLRQLRDPAAGELLFRARAMRDAAILLKQSGHAPTGAAAPLDAWLKSCVSDWMAALTVDWPRAAYEPPGDRRALLRAAESAVRSFPDLGAFEAAAARERERIADESRPLAPVGVLLPLRNGRARMLGQERPDGPVVIVVRDTGRWRFAEAVLAGRAIDSWPSGLAPGPVLVFRRVSQ